MPARAVSRVKELAGNAKCVFNSDQVVFVTSKVFGPMQQIARFPVTRPAVQDAPLPPTETEVVDVAGMLATLWRGKWPILLVSLLALAGAGYYAFALATPQYRATTVVILDTQQRTVVDLEGVMGSLSGDLATVNSEIEVLKSRNLLGKVVTKLALTDLPEFNPDLRPQSAAERLLHKLGGAIAGLPPFPTNAQEGKEAWVQDRAIDALLERTTISSLPNSVVFQIRVTSVDPERAALIADTIAELYILNQLQVKFEATQQATAWLTEQVADLRIELEEAEIRLAGFSAETKLVSVAALQALERQIKDFRDRISVAAQEQSTIQQRVSALEAAPTRADRSAAARDRTLTRLLSRIGTTSGDAAFDARYSEILERSRLDLERVNQQIDALRQSEDDIRRRIDSQNDDLIQLQQLQREAEASRALYEYFLGRLKETSAQEGIQQADSRILSNAVVPLHPSEPRHPLVLSLGAVLGALVGCVIVVLREARNTRFRSSLELEPATGFSAIGQIPRIPVRQPRKLLDYLTQKPSSRTAEAYRNLRTSVLLSDIDRPPRIIVSSSSIPGEGKTTNSLALAHNLAGMGKKVLLIEGDIRRRTLHRYFAQLPSRGLVAVLRGDLTLRDATIRPPRLGADLLVGENTAINAADLFASPQFRDLVADLRSIYDTVIIDTPPVLVVPDARIIAQEADTVLFTVKWNSTTLSQVREGLRLFSQGEQPVTGLILSQIDTRGMRRYGYDANSCLGEKYYTN